MRCWPTRQPALFPLDRSIRDEVLVLCLFSSKGGVGCSASAASLALLSARSAPTLLVDLRGDIDAILGLPTSTEGLSDWFSLDEPSPDVLHRLEVAVNPGLSLLPRGSCRSPARPERYRLLSRLLSGDGRRVVVDVGTHSVPAVALIADASASILVTRACFLALDAARRGPIADGVLLIEEPGRVLRPSDVSAAVGVGIAVQLRWHRDVARAVDAGLLSAKLPKALQSLEALL